MSADLESLRSQARGLLAELGQRVHQLARDAPLDRIFDASKPAVMHTPQHVPTAGLGVVFDWEAKDDAFYEALVCFRCQNKSECALPNTSRERQRVSSQPTLTVDAAASRQQFPATAGLSDHSECCDGLVDL